MELWHWWLIATVVVAIVEIFTPTFFALCLAVGTLLAAIVAGIGLSFSWQLLFFAVGSINAFLFVRPVMMRLMKKDEVKTGVDALTGRVGRVSESVDPALNRGRVAVDGDDWKAVPVDNQPISFGHPVEIVRVDSTILYVKKIES
jgi:membrane protein implicated in regulation of membrane protease activity